MSLGAPPGQRSIERGHANDAAIYLIHGRKACVECMTELLQLHYEAQEDYQLLLLKSLRGELTLC